MNGSVPSGSERARGAVADLGACGDPGRNTVGAGADAGPAAGDPGRSRGAVGARGEPEAEGGRERERRHGGGAARLLRASAAIALLLGAGGADPARSAAIGAGGERVERISVPGLKARVTVRRDGRGIPYIEAASAHDLWFAQGYVTAADRLWQMDLLRRTAKGELAEIFGKETLEQDAAIRKYGFARQAEGLVGRVSPRMREALFAYAAGVNANIATRGAGGLPAEFGILGYAPRPWQPSDSLVLGKIFALQLETSWPTDLLRLSLADLPSERRSALLAEESPLDVVLVDGAPGGALTGSARPAADPLADGSGAHRSRAGPERALASAGAVRSAVERALASAGAVRSALARAGLGAEGAEGAAASNDWVVSGARSATGKPILENDPHLGASAPSIWYLSELEAPGIHVSGATPPGIVGIVVGHNERIAWGVTNLMADVQDLYAETFDADGRYRTPDGPRAPEVRTETILVRGEEPGSAPSSVTRTVVATRHGPIVVDDGGAKLALRWSALDPEACELEAFFDIDTAPGWAGFTSALRRFAGPALNFVYADVSGRIGWYAAGSIPVRASGDGTVPYDGATNAGEWSGYVPFEELPHIVDPPSGVIVTANNRVVGSRYPHLITKGWVVPYRAKRIHDLLAAKPKLGVADFQAIQADTYSFADAAFARSIVAVAREALGRRKGDRSAQQGTATAAPADDDAREWRAMLAAFEGWDARASAESRVLPLAVAMRRAFAGKVLEGALGPERAKAYRWMNQDTFLDRIAADRPLAWLPKEHASWADLYLACWREGRAWLKERAGAPESGWTWGKVAEPEGYAHPLAGAPGVGARFAIEPLPKATEGSSETVNVGAGVSMRFIADLSDWDRSRQAIPLGESGDPTSPHWKDQLPAFRAVKSPELPFSRAAIVRAAARTQLLDPGAGGAETVPASLLAPQPPLDDAGARGAGRRSPGPGRSLP